MKAAPESGAKAATAAPAVEEAPNVALPSEARVRTLTPFFRCRCVMVCDVHLGHSIPPNES